jgi:eukaryotic-like serine/threonine-protein kinase
MKLEKNKLFAIVIFGFLIISTFSFAFSACVNTLTKAATSNDLSQYEWTSPAASPSRTSFSAGPAPNAPNILWKTKIPGIGGYYMVAFSGKVFAQDATSTYALDATTGAVLWHKALVGSVVKIDNTYMVIGSSCVTINDGTTIWAGPPGFAADQSVINGAGYVPELKMFVDNTYGWNLPDPSKPPTLAWNLTSQQNVGHGYEVYGDNKVFIGAEDGFLRAVDAKTGSLKWTTPLTAQFNYGSSYSDGVVYQGGLDNNLRAWDANTGKLLWTYNPGTFYGQWASSTAVAYGMVYEHNQDNYVYALNAKTGQLIWKAKGPGIGYSNTLSIGDGKIYVQMGERQYRDFDTGKYAYSEFDCFDAYTGKLIWTLPIENGAPFNSQCIAYGNLYLCPTTTQSIPGVWTYSIGGAGSIGEVWCIGGQANPQSWNMFMSDPAHTASGVGPTNLGLKWKFATNAEIVSSPAAVDGVVYFGSLDSNIYAVDANNGVQKWAFKTGFPVASSPAVVNGKVYTGADDGNVYCIDAATGSKLWMTPAGGITNNMLGAGTYLCIEPPTRSSPMVVGNKVYVGSLDGKMYCFDANTGSIQWAFKTDGPILAAPSVVDNAVYFPSSTGGLPIGSGSVSPYGDFYKLDANTGNVLWHNQIPYVLNRTFGWGNFLFASPTVAEGKVFVRNGFFYNYAFDSQTGSTIWTTTARYNNGTPFQSGGVLQINAPLYKDGVIYMNDYYGVSCINATDGKEVWFTWLSRENISPSLAYSYGRIYTVTELGVLYVLDALTGEKLTDFSGFGFSQMHGAPIAYNGNLYVGCNDWNLYCLTDSRLLASASSANTVNPSSIPSASQSPLQSETPTKSVLAIPVEAWYASAIVVVVIVVAVAAIVLRKQKPKK